MELRIERIDEAQFDAMQTEWNELLGRSPADNVFLRWEWIHTWWEIFKRNRALFMLTIRQGNRLVGLAPFYIEPANFPKARRLRFCSNDVSPDHLDIIAQESLEAPVAREIVGYIQRHAGEWDILEFDSFRSNPSFLADSSCFKNLSLSVKPSFECPYVVIQGTFDEYFNSRTKLREFNLKKKMNNLFSRKAIRHAVVENPSDLSRAIEDLFQLHKARLDHKGVETNFVGPEVQRFHEKLSRHFLEKGILKLHIIYDGETPVSARYTFSYGKKLCFYQQGFNPKYKKWSVGSLTTYLALENAFADGTHEFDILKGNEPYKALWSNAMRRDIALTAYSPTWRGAFWRAAQYLSSALKSAKRAAMGRKTYP